MGALIDRTKAPRSYGFEGAGRVNHIKVELNNISSHCLFADDHVHRTQPFFRHVVNYQIREIVLWYEIVKHLGSKRLQFSLTFEQILGPFPRQVIRNINCAMFYKSREADPKPARYDVNIDGLGFGEAHAMTTECSEYRRLWHEKKRREHVREELFLWRIRVGNGPIVTRAVGHLPVLEHVMADLVGAREAMTQGWTPWLKRNLIDGWRIDPLEVLGLEVFKLDSQLQLRGDVEDAYRPV
jgi:hypothetical protein